MIVCWPFCSCEDCASIKMRIAAHLCRGHRLSPRSSEPAWALVQDYFASFIHTKSAELLGAAPLQGNGGTRETRTKAIHCSQETSTRGSSQSTDAAGVFNRSLCVHIILCHE